MGGPSIARVEAAFQRSRQRAQRAEADATNSTELLDVLLDLIAERVVEQLRTRGWIEFHRQRPTNTTSQQRSPQQDTPETRPHTAATAASSEASTTRKQDSE